MSDSNFKSLGFWGTNGINVKKDGQLLSEMVKRVLTTRRGERVGNLSFGSDVSKFIFLPEMTIDDLVAEVRNSILRCIDGVSVRNIEIKAWENEEITITVDVEINATHELVKTEVGIVK